MTFRRGWGAFPLWLRTALFVLGVLLSLFVLMEYVNPVGDGGMVFRFRLNDSALVDVYSDEFVSGDAERRGLRNMNVRRVDSFRGARLFEVFSFDGFDGRAAKGFAFMLVEATRLKVDCCIV